MPTRILCNICQNIKLWSGADNAEINDRAIPAAMHFGTCLRMRWVKLGAKLNGKQGKINIMPEDKMKS